MTILIDHVCAMCGDIQEPWPAGKRVLERLFEDEPEALPCEALRCPTCGLIGLHANPPEGNEAWDSFVNPPDEQDVSETLELFLPKTPLC